MIILFLSAIVAICVFWTLYLAVTLNPILVFEPVDASAFSIVIGITFYLVVVALKFITCFFFGFA